MHSGSPLQLIAKIVTLHFPITKIVTLHFAIAKIVTGLLTGSVSILAAGFDSLLDALSEIIGLVTLLFARQPADLNHPYGHRKAETLGTLIWRLNQSCATAHYHLTKRWTT